MAFFSKSKQIKTSTDANNSSSTITNEQLVRSITDLVQLEEYVATLVQSFVTQFYKYELSSIPEVRASKKWFVDRQIYQLVTLQLVSYVLTHLGIPFTSVQQILNLTLQEETSEDNSSDNKLEQLQIKWPTYLQIFKNLRFASDTELVMYLTQMILNRFEEILQEREITIERLKTAVKLNSSKKENIS